MPAPTPFDPATATRPAKILLTYYLLVSLAGLVAWPILALVGFFKYETLKYRFDDDGLSMSWGILFRREINLTYRRIQDIHLTRNIVQRWLGLATVSIQTASGSANAEMEIEGILDSEGLRDFLYSKMRGAKGEHQTAAAPGETAPAGSGDPAALLRAIAADIVAVREQLAPRGGRP